MTDMISSRHSGMLHLCLGAIALSSLGVQPQLLDAAVSAGLSSELAGLLSFVEIVAMALSALAGFALLTGRRSRTLLALAAAAMIAGHLSAIGQGGLGRLAASRGLAGIGEGVLATSGVLAILGSRSPVRSSGLFIGLTAVPQLLATGWLAYLRDTGDPATAIFPILAGLGAIGLLLALFQQTALPKADLARPTRTSLAPIALMVLLNMAGSACWTYLDAWRGIALPADLSAAWAAPLCLVSQIVASILIAWRGPSGGSVAGLSLILIIEAVAVWMIGRQPTTPGFLIDVMIFGFAWQAGIPLATGLYTRSDPSLGAACLVLPMSLLGVAAGPAFAALLPADRMDLIFSVSALALILAGLLPGVRLLQQRLGSNRVYS